MRDRRRLIAALMVLVTVAAACGGRLTEEEIRAELAADGTGAEGGGPIRTGSGGQQSGSSDDDLDLGQSPGDESTSDSGNGPSTGGGEGPSGAGEQPSAPEVEAPQGGNGGATDVGVTATEITLGNVSTLSGPVPGLFRGALVGTQAAYAYQNSQGGLFGRTFKVVSGDDNFDAGQNRSRHKELKDKVFAFSGSFSLSDVASVPEIQGSGVLDVGRALAKARQDVPTHISPFPFDVGWPTTGCDYLKARFGADKIKRMAIFWGNADAARANAAWQQQACESVGFEFVYGREFQATETNFTTDAIQMQGKDVEGYLIVFDVTGIARFMKSMKQQGFVPPMRYPSPAAYDSGLFKAAGGADPLNGAIIGMGNALYLGQDAAKVPEVSLFLDWMAKVDPSQKVDIFAFYGWLSGRLMIEAMKEVGPNVTREAVLQQMQSMHAWDNFGMTESLDIGAKKPGVCETYLEIVKGEFTRVQPSNGFQCEGRFVAYKGNGTPRV
ncbi:ABC transporter substrate-binding protein [Actinospongicola halichondriae]|uniref:ABC transporter substrate-binding protein n=1 Tax=Actinospongicola halichondriae TaxID=3236844 RepID=UPI003D3DD098